MKPESFYELADILSEVAQKRKAQHAEIAGSFSDGIAWPDSFIGLANLLVISHEGRRNDWDSGYHTCSLDNHVREVAKGRKDILDRMNKWTRMGIRALAE